MASPSVVIIDYGVGNLFNVERAFRALGAETLITNNPDEILKAERILLPGVGAFAPGMENLRKHDLVGVLQSVAAKGTVPFLGICLGMQLLMERSEENGSWTGLGLIPGEVKRFSASVGKIPQIGWNTLEGTDWGGTILDSVAPGSFVYFVHSYHVIPKDPQTVLAQTTYGSDTFCSVIRHGNIWGCQFHPERSSEAGLAILRSFLKT